MAAHQIAEADGVSLAQMHKVLRRLARAGIVRSVIGVQGGYVLARPPGDVSLLEVVEALDGPLRGEAPTWEPGADGAAVQRLNERLQAVCGEAAQRFRARLGRVSLDELAGRKK